jgi:hypothetical protein
MSKDFDRRVFDFYGKNICRHAGQRLPASENIRTDMQRHEKIVYLLSELGKPVKGHIRDRGIGYSGETSDRRVIRNLDRARTMVVGVCIAQTSDALTTFGKAKRAGPVNHRPTSDHHPHPGRGSPHSSHGKN